MTRASRRRSPLLLLALNPSPVGAGHGESQYGQQVWLSTLIPVPVAATAIGGGGVIVDHIETVANYNHGCSNRHYSTPAVGNVRCSGTHNGYSNPGWLGKATFTIEGEPTPLIPSSSAISNSST